MSDEASTLGLIIIENLLIYKIKMFGKKNIENLGVNKSQQIVVQKE